MSSLSVGSSSGSPLTISGLASGLDTSAIINALMAVERAPATRLTGQQEKLQIGQQQLRSIQSGLRQLAFAASEFSLPSLFEGAQTVTSSEPLRVGAATSAGAGVGGYEVEVKQLANSAQRTFTFASPAAEDTITIDGREYTLKAGASAKELASKINSDGSGTVYAAAVEGGKVVLSNRATGNTGAEFIKVTDPGGALSENAGTAKEGRNAEYVVDGVAGTSASNTVTTAIAGVTLTLAGLPTSGPVTIDVLAPGPSVSAIEAQVQSFIKTYNSSVEAIQRQITTKPVSNPQNASEAASGMLFGDIELTGLLDSMRQAMYEPIAGLPAEMASPFAIGVSTGAPTGGSASQSSIQGLLKLEPAALSKAVQANPAGVEQMLQSWSKKLQGIVNGVSEPGGSLESRVTEEGTEVNRLRSRISTMNEMLAVRQRALQATYSKLESIISKNSAQSAWLLGQTEQMNKSGL
ncbi:MAG TPA: flagellar filament capping protein FliD [Solirubrobacteraceae bacterium]|nr:flagellar filament capping protein FliD [Solirubrobacteraceae bacterium]